MTTKKFIAKNGLQSQNVDFVSPNGSSTLSFSMSDTGTLSVSGTAAGQLFSITDSLSGVIHSVNNASGVPSFEVYDTGEVRLAEYGGNVGFGTASPTDKVHVAGSVRITGAIKDSTNAAGTSGYFLSSTGTGTQWIAPPSTTLTGDITGSGTGSISTTLANSGVTAGSYTNANITVDAKGRVTAASSGSAGGPTALSINSRNSSYTVVAGDLGKVINLTANTFTVSLTSAATLGAGFYCYLWNTGSGNVTIDPAGSETIDNLDTLVLRHNQGAHIVSDGTNWKLISSKRFSLYAESLAGGFTRPTATGDSTVAIGGNASATADYATAVGLNAGATAKPSLALGCDSNYAGSQAVAQGAIAIGGSRASGVDSFAAAISNNTTTYGAQNTGAIAIGWLAKATGNGSVAIGGGQGSGSGPLASNTEAFAFGPSAVASGQNSIALGKGATASSTGGIAIGGGNSYLSGQVAFGTSTDGRSLLVTRATTTNATPVDLDLWSGGQGFFAAKLAFRANSAVAFTATVVAMQSAAQGTQSAAWKIEGLLRKGATIGTTTIVNSAITVISNTPGWGVAVSAETATYGALYITVTGAASTTIKWACTIDATEVVHA